jgi:hypothetical protein
VYRKDTLPQIGTEPSGVIDMGKHEKRVYLEAIRKRYRRAKRIVAIISYNKTSLNPAK